MNSTGKSVVVLLIALLLVQIAAGQGKRHEQTSFGMEGPPPIRPVPVPDAVVDILRKDKRLEKCGPDVLVTKDWFTASEIHLDADKPVDLVVLPVEGCLFGANIAPFWVFRQTTHGYELVLVTDTLGLEILRTRTKGYRDIRSSAATAIELLTTLYKFDGATYQPSQHLCEAIGSIRYHCVFFLARRELQQRTQVPLMLPTELSFRYDPADPEQPGAFVEHASSDAYKVMIAWGADCNGAHVCTHWWVAGRKLEPGERIAGKMVHLAKRTMGYFVEGECGAYCNPSTMSWVKNGYLYTIAEKGSSEKELARIANSAIADSR